MHFRSVGFVARIGGVWCLAILLALGSKSYDPEPGIVLPPVTVDFAVVNSGTVEFEDGTTDDSVTFAALSGTFTKAANARITLRDVPVTLDVNTSWTADILPTEADNLLRGELSAAVTAPLEFGINRLPAAGQISNDYEGTSTLVTFDGNANNVMVQTEGIAAQTLTFADFRNAHTDTNRDIDERMASKAWRLLENLWQVARISETLHREIEQQLGTLEASGLRTSVTLTCDNSSGTPAPSYVMRWEVDVNTGTGQGAAGNGDNFSANWTNCLLNADGRYLDEALEISNYQLANQTTPRSMSFSAEAQSLFFATQALAADAFPEANQERVDGTLMINVSEQ